MKPPAFQFYVDNFIEGTVDFSPYEEGCYIRLLCYQWSRGFIPNEPRLLKLIAGGKVPASVLKKFPKQNGVRLNERMELERDKQDAFRQKQSEKGKKSAESRRTTVEPRLNHGSIPVGSRLQPEGQPKANSPSPSPSPDVERETHLPEIPPMNRKDFDLMAKMRGVPKECAEWFWNTCDSRNWVDSVGQPIKKVEPLLMNALKNWRSQINGKNKFSPPEQTAKQKLAMWNIK